MTAVGEFQREQFAHVALPAAQVHATLLVLHGTGGNEHDLVPLAQQLLPGAAILSPRGQVLEHGKPRFFRRHAEGILDLEDLAARTVELTAWVKGAVQHYQLPSQLIALGFSNGANIAASMLLTGTGLLQDAVLLRAMLPFEPPSTPSLTGVRVYMGSGQQDPLIPVAQPQRLADLLQAGGAEVSLHWEPAGHGLTPRDITTARSWLQRTVV